MEDEVTRLHDDDDEGPAAAEESPTVAEESPGEESPAVAEESSADSDERFAALSAEEPAENSFSAAGPEDDSAAELNLLTAVVHGLATSVSGE